ncbi:MAG: hypothetical protein ACNFW9_03960 [Candidatus Kerfeldbacteria bacterium]
MVNKKEQVEDIFAEVEKTPVSKKVIKKSKPVSRSRIVKQPVLPTNSNPINSRKGSPMRALVIFVIVVILGMAYVIISGFFDSGSENTTNTGNTNLTNYNPPATNSNSTTNIDNTDVTLPINVNTGPLDTDGDGLSDEEEIKIGTSLTSKDTDGDGLFDREEVEVYKTNPKLKDTDRDGMDDGVEIENGYNPNGEGLLLDLQEAIKNL